MEEKKKKMIIKSWVEHVAVVYKQRIQGSITLGFYYRKAYHSVPDHPFLVKSPNRDH